MSGTPPPPSLRSRLLLTFLTNAAFVASGVVTGALLARFLGPTGRGELAAVTLWPELLMLLAGLGLAPTVAYFVAANPQSSGRVYGSALALAVLQWVAVAGTGLVFVPLALGPGYAHALDVSLAYLCLAPLTFLAAVQAGLLQGRLRMGRHSVQRLLPTAAYLAALVVLALSARLDVSSAVAALLGSMLLSVLAGAFLVRHLLAGGLSLDRGLQVAMARFGLKSQAAELLQTLSLRLGPLVLSLWVAPAVLGHYAVALGATSFFIAFGHAIGVVALPDVAGRHPSDQAGRVAALLRLSALVLVPGALLLMAFTPWLVPLLYGAEFQPAVPPALVLSAAALFLSLNAVLTDGLRGMRAPGVAAMAHLVCLAATAAAMSLLVPRAAVMGAAAATVLGNAAGFAVMIGWLNRRAGVALRSLAPGAADVKMALHALYAPWRVAL